MLTDFITSLNILINHYSATDAPICCIIYQDCLFSVIENFEQKLKPQSNF